MHAAARTRPDHAHARTSIYAILAVNFFAGRSPEYFGSFSKALFTLFQVRAFLIHSTLRPSATAGKSSRGYTVVY